MKKSDRIGEDIIGEQPNNILKDEAASSINNLRTHIWLKKSRHCCSPFWRRIQTMEYGNGCSQSH